MKKVHTSLKVAQGPSPFLFYEWANPRYLYFQEVVNVRNKKIFPDDTRKQQPVCFQSNKWDTGKV